MKVPVVVLTYNRPDLLPKVLRELDRVNTPKPILIFDDGSDNDEQRKYLIGLEKNLDYIVFPMYHLGYRNQFSEVGRILGKMNIKYFVFVEDDASFSINWYQWSIKVLEELEKTYTVGALSLYSGHSKANGEKVLPNVYKHINDHFYGTCGIIVNTSYIEQIKEVMFTRKGCSNPDVAMRQMSVDKTFNLFVAFPNIVQHEGVDRSLVIAPKHHSSTFIGNDKDILKEFKL